MQMNRTGRIHYLTPDLPEQVPCLMGFTTRHEGVSRPPYNSLNLGTNTDDASHNVEGNRSILTRAFGLPLEKLVTVRQNHGSDILVIDEPNEDFSHFLNIECDAIVTNQPGVMLGVTVADCVPILLCDPTRQVVAAVHAGWQGTAARLVAQTVDGMRRLFGCDPAQMLAAIGPCIGQCCYEVDQPVQQAFLNSRLNWESITEPADTGKWRLDMALANRQHLEEAGLLPGSIQTAGQCVCCQKELFFSYRRDAGETGRQMGFVMIKEG